MRASRGLAGHRVTRNHVRRQESSRMGVRRKGRCGPAVHRRRRRNRIPRRHRNLMCLRSSPERHGGLTGPRRSLNRLGCFAFYLPGHGVRRRCGTIRVMPDKAAVVSRRVLILAAAKPAVLEPDVETDLGNEKKSGISGPRIRCPLCGWRPGKHDRWLCLHPAPTGVCGHRWNTFDTGGICPACLYQWTVTACLSCLRMSPHSDWYEY
jgi:hypothetical protein